MENKLLCYPVMLPTNDRPPFFKEENNPYFDKKLNLNTDNEIETEGNQHLYLVSDRKIGYNDWAMFDSKSLAKPSHDENLWGFVSNKMKRLEATTDPSLGLPLIPTTWLEDEWIGKQGEIKDVYIELHNDGNISLVLGNAYTGQVIILPVKDSWNREQVKAIAYEAFVRGSVHKADIAFYAWFDKKY